MPRGRSSLAKRRSPRKLAKSKADLDARLGRPCPPSYRPGRPRPPSCVAASPCWAGHDAEHGRPVQRPRAAAMRIRPCFLPEQDADLKRTYMWTAKLAWKAQPDWQDGKTFQLPARHRIVLFVPHHPQRASRSGQTFIQSERAPTKVWLNGQLAHNVSQKQRRSLNSIAVSWQVKAITNCWSKSVTTGRTGCPDRFQDPKSLGWQTAPPSWICPLFIVEALAQPAAHARTDDVRQAMALYQVASDPRVRDRRNAIERLTWAHGIRDPTAVSRANRVPPRASVSRSAETACACERSSEPTVDQAAATAQRPAPHLQPVEHSRQTVRSRTSANDALLDELYLTAAGSPAVGQGTRRRQRLSGQGQGLWRRDPRSGLGLGEHPGNSCSSIRSLSNGDVSILARSPGLTLATAVHLSAAEVSFLRDVAPILTGRCTEVVHGSDQDRRRLPAAHVRLLAEAGANRARRPWWPASRKPPSCFAASSRAIESIRMPQEDDPLSPAEVDTVKRWIAAGARFDGTDVAASIKSLMPLRASISAPPAVYRVPVPVFAVAFSPDGRELAVGGNYEVNVRDPTDGRLLRRIGHLPQRHSAHWFTTKTAHN